MFKNPVSVIKKCKLGSLLRENKKTGNFSYF